MNKFLLVILILFLNCASIPKKHFLLINQESKDNLFESTDSIIAKEKPLQYTEKFKSEIDQKDDIILLPGEGIVNKSKFELIKLSIIPQKEYQLELISKCDCFGFTKTIMRPILLLLDEKGQIVNQKPEIFEQRDATWTLPVHIYAKWRIKTDGNLLYAIVAADNSVVGKNIRDVATPLSSTIGAVQLGLTGVLITSYYPFLSGPYGKYEIIFNEYSNEIKESKVHFRALN